MASSTTSADAKSFAVAQNSEHVWVVDPKLGPDVTATLMAKISRGPNIDLRFEQLVKQADGSPETWDLRDPPKPVRGFMDRNLKAYSHASIAELATTSLCVQGIGTPMSWLLLDFPRFCGQENSSRVVDQESVPNSRVVCDGAPVGLQGLHERWLSLYDSLDGADRGAASKAYTFDDKRFALPGTMRTGMGISGAPLRDVVRHVEMLKSWSGGDAFVAGLSDEVVEGASVWAPCLVDAIRRDGRGHNRQTWDVTTRQDLMLDEEGVLSTPGDGIVYLDYEAVSQVAGLSAEQRDDLRRALAAHVAFVSGMNVDTKRESARAYISDLYESCPRIKVRQYVSWGTARDEHRHRRAMPFKLSIPTGSDGKLRYVPWTPFDVPGELWQDTQEAFASIMEEASTPAERWQALYALPFCAMVCLEYTLPLPALIYKAELRAGAPNGHWEYKAQNLEIIRRYCEILPEPMVVMEMLDGLLEGEHGENQI